MKKSGSMVLRSGQYYLNDKPFFLYSGEIHYFRTPSEKWSTYLKMARKAGLNTVATYIPWRWHEYEEGKFDFTGRTIKERNLLGFLKKCEEEGLFVVLRAGPMCHAEIIDDGLPAWLLDNYPEIGLKKTDGSLFRGAMISFLHPAYLQFVKKWYEKIIPLIAARQITAGGKVISVQLDNEISMINWLTKVPDTSKAAMSLYHSFLRKKYGSIQELNAAFGSRYKNFSQVKYPLLTHNNQPGISYWVWVDFMREFYASYYGFLAKEAKVHGINVPLIANIAHFADFDVRGRGIWSPMTSSMFTSFPKKVDNLVLGGAYQMRRLDYENFHDVAITTEAVKMVSDSNAPVMCVEMQSGVIFDKPVLYPPDVDLNILTSIAHGLNGLNAYLFASGRNLPDMGTMGTRHNWQAAVDLEGNPRPHYKSIAKWGGILKTFGTGLSETKKHADVSIGLYLPYYMTEFLQGSFGSGLEQKRNGLFFDGICRLLELAGYNYDIVNLQADSLSGKKNLFVFCLDFMDKATQMKIAAFVKNGGNLIIGPELPRKDIDLKKCAFLREEFNFVPRVSEDSFIKEKSDLLFVDKPIRTFRSKAEALFKTESGQKAAVFKKYKKGRLIVHGFGFRHVFDYHVDMLKKVLDKLNIKSMVEKKSNRDIQTALRISGKRGYLFAVNYHQIDKKVKLSLRDFNGKKVILPQRGHFTLPARSGRMLPLNFTVSERLTILKTTAQIVSLADNKKDTITIKLLVTRDGYEEINLKLKGVKEIVLDGKKYKSKQNENNYLVSFRPQNNTATLIINFKKNS